MDGFRIQQELFEKIKLKINDPKNWIDHVADILSISKPAVYKRISGSTSLSLDDLARLIQEYGLSFDDLVVPERRQIGFMFPYMNSKIKSFIDYLTPLRESAASLARIPNVKVWYATNELSFFYYFLHSDLTYFKFFIYARTIWNLPAYHDKKLQLSEFSGEQYFSKIIREILDHYKGLDSIEFWNVNILNNTLNQIKYFLSAGMFAIPEEAFVLCDKLSDVMKHVKKMAELGKKFDPGSSPSENSAEFKMYHNEISHTNNIGLIKSPYTSFILSAYDNPNFIITEDPGLVDYTFDWFQRIKKSSLPISEDAERSRLAFFTQIEKRIDMARTEIETIISTM